MANVRTARAKLDCRALNREYFTNYCSRGSYDENYLAYSRVEHCISIVGRLQLDVSTVLVLGAATGRVLEHFDSAWGIRPWGCEISQWAHARIAARYRRRIKRAEMRHYVLELAEMQRSFDLCFSNALVYLAADQVPEFLRACCGVVGHFHFWSSTIDDYEPHDTYRVTLRSKRWWRKAFMENGFQPTRSPYLWKSRIP